MFSNAFLNFFFVLWSVTIHEVDFFYQSFLDSFLELFLFYFWQQFLVFLVRYPSILHLLYYIQPFTCTINNTNHNNNSNKNNNNNINHNDDDDHENETMVKFSVFNLHQLYIYLQNVCYSFIKL